MGLELEGNELASHGDCVHEGLDRLANDKVIMSVIPSDMYKKFHWYKNDEWERFMHTVTEWDEETYMDCLP